MSTPPQGPSAAPNKNDVFLAAGPLTPDDLHLGGEMHVSETYEPFTDLELSAATIMRTQSATSSQSTYAPSTDALFIDEQHLETKSPEGAVGFHNRDGLFQTPPKKKHAARDDDDDALTSFTPEAPVFSSTARTILLPNEDDEDDVDVTIKRVRMEDVCPILILQPIVPTAKPNKKKKKKKRKKTAPVRQSTKTTTSSSSLVAPPKKKTKKSKKTDNISSSMLLQPKDPSMPEQSTPRYDIHVLPSRISRNGEFWYVNGYPVRYWQSQGSINFSQNSKKDWNLPVCITKLDDEPFTADELADTAIEHVKLYLSRPKADSQPDYEWKSPIWRFKHDPGPASKNLMFTINDHPSQTLIRCAHRMAAAQQNKIKGSELTQESDLLLVYFRISIRIKGVLWEPELPVYRARKSGKQIRVGKASLPDEQPITTRLLLD